ncbi:hypothetical protein DSECCO2_592620 [anaerobic digester metagenome]
MHAEHPAHIHESSVYTIKKQHKADEHKKKAFDNSHDFFSWQLEFESVIQEEQKGDREKRNQ